MSRPVAGIVLVAVLLAGAWSVNLVRYGDDGETPGWLVAIWLALWALLVTLVAWTVARAVRARARGRAGPSS